MVDYQHVVHCIAVLMAKRFSIVIEIDNKGKVVPHVYLKEKAADAQALFFDLRNKGVEAYFFHHPHPDKHSKSLVQKAASAGTAMNPESIVPGSAEAVKAETKAEAPAAESTDAPKKKGNKIFGLGFGG